MIITKFKKLSTEAIIPDKRSDLSPIIVFRCPKDSKIEARTVTKISLDLALQMETNKGVEVKGGAELQIFNPGTDILPPGLVGVTGTVDAQYRGNIAVLISNNSEHVYTLKRGVPIAYGKVTFLPEIDIQSSKVLSETIRGDKGFGSTGI